MFVPYALMYINKCVYTTTVGIDLLNCWPGQLVGRYEYRPAGIHWATRLIRINPVNPTLGFKQLVGDADRFYTEYIGLYVVFIWHSGRLWSVVIHVHVAKNFGCWEGGGGGVFKLTSGIGICIDMHHKMEATLKISI